MSLMKKMARLIQQDMKIKRKSNYGKVLSYGNNQENYEKLKEMALKEIIEHLKGIQDEFNSEKYTLEKAIYKVWSNNYIYDYSNTIVLDDVVLHNYGDEKYEQQDYYDMEHTINTVSFYVFVNSDPSLEKFEKDAIKGKASFRVTMSYTNTARDNYRHPDDGSSKTTLLDKDVSVPIHFIFEDGPSYNFNVTEDMYNEPTTIEIDYENLPNWL